MNPHLKRAELLVHVGRYDDAVTELRQAQAAEPENAYALALLAMCLAEQKKYAEASQAAKCAIGLAPDNPYPYLAQSIVLERRNRSAEAEAAIREAIALDPNNTLYHAHLARVLFNQRRWKQAREAAEAGLALDPEDVDCTNLRAMSLVKLGEKSGAGEALATALKRDPEDAFSHANLGWALLEQRRPEQAMEHFRESLRLNPESEWARAGMVEAMKARYFVYGLMLNYFLWMMKLSRQAQWGFVLGGWLGYQVLRQVAKNNQALAPWITPFLIAYIAFVVMTWVASPLFNLVLRLNRFGRLALSREQIITSNWVGLCLLGAIGSLIAYCFVQQQPLLYAALVCGLMIPPLAHIYSCSDGWPRNSMIAISAVLFLLGAATVSTGAGALLLNGPAKLTVDALSGMLFLAFVAGAIGSQFAVNALVGVQPKL